MSRQRRKRTQKEQQSLVMAGYVSPGVVESSFALSLATNVITERRLQGFTAGSSARINRVRNDLFHDFLKTPKEFEWFWMVDADMVLPEDALKTLLNTAHVMKRKLVGGLGYIFKPEQNPSFIPSILLEPTPELMAHVDPDTWEPGMKCIINSPPKERYIEAASTGFFCLLIHRSVIEEMFAAYGESYNNPWIDEVEQGFGNSPKGPDLEFFERAKNATGETVLIDTSVQCGHTKQFVITHQMAQQHWDQFDGS